MMVSFFWRVRFLRRRPRPRPLGFRPRVPGLIGAAGPPGEVLRRFGGGLGEGAGAAPPPRRGDRLGSLGVGVL